MNLISSYFQFNEEIEPYILHWEKIIRGIGTGCLLTGDVNARSPLWLSTEGNMNGGIREGYVGGENIEEFIISHELIACNEPGHLPTYAGEIDTQEGSNIDLTLRTKNTKIGNWQVGEEGIHQQLG